MVKLVNKEQNRETYRTNIQRPLFFIHGAWHAAWVWDAFARFFDLKGFRTYIISLPGHKCGRMSSCEANTYTFDDYVAYVQEAVAPMNPPPVLIGHSLGGAIVQKCMCTLPVRAAVLLAPIPIYGTAKMMRRLMIRHPLATMKAILKKDTYEWVRTPGMAKSLFLSNAERKDLQEFHSKLTTESFAVGEYLCHPLEFKNTYKVPVLLIAAERDTLFSVSEQQITAAALQAEFLVRKNQAHNLMIEPGWRDTAQIIYDWIMKVG
jgi:pimeloyl-ACP methyl ester carboxylesterase